MSEPSMCSKIQRMVSVEWLRFFAAFGIVWFHTNGAAWRSVGYAGLPVFLLVFCALIVAHYSEIPLKTFLQRRAIRLLIPWAFWSLVYVAAKMAKLFFVSREPFEGVELNWLLVGGNIHLRYLPFAFLASVCLYYACRLTLKTQISPALLISALCLGVLALFLSAIKMAKFPNTPPFSQWLFALPSLPIGFCLGAILRGIPVNRQPLWLWSVFVFVLLVLGVLYFTVGNYLIVPYSIGLCLTIIALQFQFPFQCAGVQIGQLTYGIYLIHPLIAFCIDGVIGDQCPGVRITSTFFVSAVVVFLMRLTFLRRVV